MKRSYYMYSNGNLRRKDNTITLSVSDADLGEAFSYVNVDYYNPQCYVDMGEN